jgi:perosamine synthetase
MNESYSLAKAVRDAIHSVVGDGPVSLHEPFFDGNESLYVKECIDSSVVSSVGSFVTQFESQICQFTGSLFAVATCSGTAALHLALKVAGVKANDEVLIPALTFVATANAVTYCNAVPHFVDSEARTLGIDVEKLRRYLFEISTNIDGRCVNKMSGRVIKAVVPMHTFGHPSDIDGLIRLASEFNLILVEDAAESLGSTYRGKHTGTFGITGALSFNGNKIITTGGGGAMLTNDPDLAERARHLATTAKIPHFWEYRHDEVGYNYRMPNINAALGCAQMEMLPRYLNEKKELYKLYQRVFEQIDCLELKTSEKHCSSNFWLQTIILDNEAKHFRDDILKITNEAGYQTRPVWVLLNELAPFLNAPSMNMHGAQTIYQKSINIPSSAFLSANGRL